MSIKPKTIFVGPRELGDVLAKNREDLNFVAYCESISELDKGLRDGKINNEIDVIITIDLFFKPDGSNKEFENMVAFFSPYCLMLIVQYNPDNENLLREQIRSSAIEQNEAGNEEFYFVSPKTPNIGIDNAKSSYISNHPDSEIAYVLQGIDSSEIGEDELVAEKEYAEPMPGENINDYEVDNTPGTGKIIALTSSKGGTGVSTISTLLTAYVSHATKNAIKSRKETAPKICLLDLNLSNGQLGFIIGALRPSILKMRSDGISLKTLQETTIYSEQIKADCILLPQKPRLAENLTLEFLNDTLEFLKKHYDFIFIDTTSSYIGTELDVVEKVVFPQSDLIIYVTDCSSTSLLSMARWVETVKAPKNKDGMNIPIEKIGVVVNDYIPDVGIDGQKIAQLSRGLPIITVVPSNRRLAIKATNQQSLAAMLKDDNFKEAIEKLAVSVVGDDYPLSKRIF